MHLKLRLVAYESINWQLIDHYKEHHFLLLKIDENENLADEPFKPSSFVSFFLHKKQLGLQWRGDLLCNFFSLSTSTYENRWWFWMKNENPTKTPWISFYVSPTNTCNDWSCFKTKIDDSSSWSTTQWALPFFCCFIFYGKKALKPHRVWAFETIMWWMSGFY